jgi:hypothetical protein
MQAILWRRLDVPGHEWASLVRQDDDWVLSGTAILVHAERPCQLQYRVVCNRHWETVSSQIKGWTGGEPVDIRIDADANRRWKFGGVAHPAVEGCIDVDLGFSPATNLLPIRRLGLEVGEEAAVTAAWLAFPNFEFQPLEQLYRRTGQRFYEYQSRGGKFVAELEVNAAGLVTRYGQFWQAEAEA